MKQLPGTLWINRSRWNWKVRLPGTPTRRNYPLRIHGQRTAIPEKKGRSLAESLAWRMWESASRHDTAHDTRPSLDGICGLFLDWGRTYYRTSDGRPTREVENCSIALRSIRADYGRMPIDDITYQNILDTREKLIQAGHNRTTINQRVGIWKRFFAWALENRQCSAQTKSEVCAIVNLKRNRTAAPEGSPVKPVDHRTVKAIMPFLPPTLRAMVAVHELCGARPSEMCIMRAADIERRRDAWVYRPATHKTEHKNQCRVIVLGPRAQRVLEPVIDMPGFLFNPKAAEAERKTAARARRKSRVQLSQVSRAREGAKSPGPCYTSNTYGAAIQHAIRAARRAGVEVEDWSPNQLRHACGTRVRRKFGPDSARAVLGHAGQGGSKITDTYTRDAIERELIKIASRPMIAIG
jgi:integrase